MNRNVFINVSNRLNKILNEKGIANIRPTDQQLIEMQISIHRFNQILRNKGHELLFSEALLICSWLKELGVNVNPEQLYDVTAKTA